MEWRRGVSLAGIYNIVTKREYEGKKLCQNMLEELIPMVNSENVFATTRKPSMAHILSKFEFSKEGKTYKKDLNVFVLNNKKEE